MSNIRLLCEFYRNIDHFWLDHWVNQLVKSYIEHEYPSHYYTSITDCIRRAYIPAMIRVYNERNRRHLILLGDQDITTLTENIMSIVLNKANKNG